MNNLAKFHLYLKDQYKDGLNDVNVIAVEDMARECGITVNDVYRFLEILEDDGIEYYFFSEMFGGEVCTMCEFYINV